MSKLNETKIMQRMIAALTQRQMPLSVQNTDTTISPKLRRLMKKTKQEIKKKDLMLPSTLKIKASTAASPVYAFSILPVVRNNSIGYRYSETNESPLAYNPPYGILPQLATSDPEELLRLANHFSVLKYQYQERGDYYHAWLFGWRQRMIERVLNRTAQIDVEFQ
jgi:hypothetical protein